MVCGGEEDFMKILSLQAWHSASVCVKATLFKDQARVVRPVA